jgi:hypothetical protein
MTHDTTSAAPAEAASQSESPAAAAPAAAPAGRAAFEPFSAEAAIAGKGAGEALPGGISGHLSASFGADVSGARVHNDANANRAADSAGAEAFAYGNDIFFGSGKYAPETQHGSFVLAHEVAHVAQQSDVPRAHLADAVAQGNVEHGSEADSAETEAPRPAPRSPAARTRSPAATPASATSSRAPVTRRRAATPG